jgi:hypothetical protein
MPAMAFLHTRRFLVPLFAAAIAACAPAGRPAPAAGPASGEDVIRQMHDRYPDWYRTLSFTQATSRRLPNDSVSVETWREWSAIPGRLRIEMGDPAAGRGAIFANDSVYNVRGGQATTRAARRNLLLVLGFDVYGQSPERTLQVLREEGIDLSRVHTDTWEGRRVYVVGANEGDLQSRQFWVEADRLLFVRLIEPGAQSPSVLNDIRFTDYKQFRGGWVAARVEVYNGGRRVLWEDYSDIRIDEPLDPALFDPARWTTAPHPAPR